MGLWQGRGMLGTAEALTRRAGTRRQPRAVADEAAARLAGVDGELERAGAADGGRSAGRRRRRDPLAARRMPSDATLVACVGAESGRGGQR